MLKHHLSPVSTAIHCFGLVKHVSVVYDYNILCFFVDDNISISTYTFSCHQINGQYTLFETGKVNLNC